MNHLVEKLRRDGETVESLKVKGHWSSACILEQADDIEHLRAENARLKAAHAAACDLAEKHMTEKHALRAENERMREALEWYAKTFCEGIENGCGNMTEMDCSGCRARAALTEPTHD